MCAGGGFRGTGPGNNLLPIGGGSGYAVRNECEQVLAERGQGVCMTRVTTGLWNKLLPMGLQVVAERGRKSIHGAVVQPVAYGATPCYLVEFIFSKDNYC